MPVPIDPPAVSIAGRYSLRWVSLVPGVDILDENFLLYDLEMEEFTEMEEEEDTTLNEQHLTAEELQEIADHTEIDKLYLVKWRNMSYNDATWEPESIINNPGMIANFMKFNRSLDTHARKDMTNLTNNFYRVINQQSMDSTVKKNKINFSKHHYYQYLRLIDFPTHDFAIPVH